KRDIFSAVASVIASASQRLPLATRNPFETQLYFEYSPFRVVFKICQSQKAISFCENIKKQYSEIN
ncbi:MAG: hypothetical protein K2H01_08500, partial [Ruminococcus sp.]|nr:hypothetical protein [Ruminococcus sp.]